MENREIEDASRYKKGFIKNYNEDSDTGCSLEGDLRYPRKSNETQKDLSFLPEKNEKVVHTLGDKE